MEETKESIKPSVVAVNSITDVTIPNIEEKTRVLTPNDLLNKPDKDLDLVKLVEDGIRRQVGDEEAEWFLHHKVLKIAHGVHSITQRVLINRWIIQTILRAKFYNELESPMCIISALPFDGKHEEWLKYVSKIVLPYFKEHDIIKTLIDKEKVSRE